MTETGAPTIAELLAFEEKWGRDPKRHGLELEACYSDLGIPPARYFLLIGRAIDTREALEVNPMLVHRLRRIRDDKQLERERRTGAS